MKYRSDINGLRAISILVILFFHAHVSVFRNGFLGVDIFFVLSGYLITSIIISEIAVEQFSIAAFYERRVRRILPALIFMITTTSLIFASFLLPDDLENLGQSIVSTALFSNNILLWLTSSYFDQSIDFKPYAHSWSLGVEEQFYILAPLLLIAGSKFAGRRGMFCGLLLFSVLSFAFCVFVSRGHPLLNFYLLTSRFWEIGFGSIAAFLQIRSDNLSNRFAGILALAGFGGVTVSILPILPMTNNPNEWTLLPVFSTCLILLFSRSGSLVMRVLSIRALVFVGLISYSLYLWHQPLFVLLRLTSLDQPAPIDYVPAAIASFVMAVFSWHFIEKPFRDKTKISSRTMEFWTISGSALLLVFGFFFYLTSGLLVRWPELGSEGRYFGARQNTIYSLSARRYLERPFSSANSKQNVLVIGNSFARDVLNMFDEDPDIRRLNFSYVDADICDAAALRRQTKELAPHAQFIVYGLDVDSQKLACIKQHIGQLKNEREHNFVVFGPKNFGWNNNAIMQIPSGLRYQYRAKVMDDVIANNKAAAGAIYRSDYVDILGMLGAGQDNRVPIFTPDKKFISHDRRHFTQAGARFVMQRIAHHPAIVKMRMAAVNSEHLLNNERNVHR
jgi:peptidoglycan/LPS O-acetylase OafA/YrhL